MTAQQHDDDQAAARDAAYGQALAIVAASYTAETAGKQLTRRQRDEQVRAERLARWLQREAAKQGGRP